MLFCLPVAFSWIRNFWLLKGYWIHCYINAEVRDLVKYCASDHMGGIGKEGSPTFGPLLCARHKLGALLSSIIPMAQIRKNAEKLSNLPNTYRWKLEKPESQNEKPILVGCCAWFLVMVPALPPSSGGLGLVASHCGPHSVSSAIKWLQLAAPQVVDESS